MNKKPSVVSGSSKLFANHGRKATTFPQINKGIKSEMHADTNALLYALVSIILQVPLVTGVRY